MARCRQCGNRGLFLKVNASGICEECYQKAQEKMQQRARFDAIDAQFQMIQKKHGEFSSKINSLRNRAIQGKDPKLTKECEKLCEKDIALALEYMRLYRELQREGQTLYGWRNEFPVYASFETLAFIRHRQGKGEEAIRLCQQHIDMGFGRAEEMKERIELFKTPYEQPKPKKRTTGGSEK